MKKQKINYRNCYILVNISCEREGELFWTEMVFLALK